MSSPGRPKSEYRSAQHEGAPMSRCAAMGQAGAHFANPKTNPGVRSPENLW